MKSLTYTIKSLLYSMIFLTSATGCQDDIHFSDPANGIGEPVTVTLKLSLPEMTPQSRADISDEVANEVTDIWVGIFDASGNLTGHKYQSVNHNDTHVTHTVSVDTKTGPSHIVAVANVTNNYGVMLTDGNADSRAQTTILDLLEQEGLNWDKFLSIANLLPQPGSIETPNGHIPMCGIYSDDSDPKNHPTDSWEDLYNQTVNITSSGLSGHIHLRRLISQVKVQLQVTGNIVDIEPYSWQVINVPRASWLLERDGDQTNATDAVTGEDNWLDDSPVHGPEYFPFIDKVKFDDKGNYVQDDSNNKAFVFDFWQTENKHTISCSSYEARESAARNSDVTYIEFKCRITYKTIPETSSQDQYIDGSTVSRTADATYIIPLGGIDKDYSDFNHRRNSRYIYNVTISDVTQILVEAHTNKEERPGVEGIVTDLTNPMVHLDAHYSVMNISLTKEELADACPLDKDGKRGTFRFRMDVYDQDNELIRIDNDNHTDYSESADDTKKLYVNWIEIRPTTNENTYAAYKPISDNDTKYIYQFGDYLDDEKWSDKETRWFTVFINEYTYETGNTTTNWKNYVNKDERKAWFIADKYQNDDQTSVHFKAKYGLSQQSIQTYYNSDPNAPTERAIGVEHFNETIGARLRWDGDNNKDEPDYPNGKTYALEYIDNVGKPWSNYVTTTKFATPEIIGATQKGQGTEASHPAYVPKPQTMTSQGNDGYNDPTYADNSYNEYYVAVQNACMNRNRDLDGDGEISTNEIRWYVPTARQYQRIILGRNSLASPIMQNFDNITLYASSGTTLDINNNNTRYHLASSDKQMIWAEEGLSRSGFHGGWQKGAWQVRCIRNLGTNDETATDIKIPPAYTPVNNKRVFEMDRYDSRSVRNNKIISRIPLHHIYNQEYNRIYSAFEFAERDIKITNSVWDGYPSSWSQILLGSTDPCDELNQQSQNNGKSKWRVPNQKEITMMFYAEILDTSSQDSDRYHYYISATQEFFDYHGNAYTNNFNNRRFLGITIDTVDPDYRSSTAINWDRRPTLLRCVRDVDPDEYPDDITDKP